MASLKSLFLLSLVRFFFSKNFLLIPVAVVFGNFARGKKLEEVEIRPNPRQKRHSRQTQSKHSHFNDQAQAETRLQTPQHKYSEIILKITGLTFQNAEHVNIRLRRLQIIKCCGSNLCTNRFVQISILTSFIRLLKPGSKKKKGERDT
jgi:hypothetical protein